MSMYGRAKMVEKLDGRIDEMFTNVRRMNLKQRYAIRDIIAHAGMPAFVCRNVNKSYTMYYENAVYVIGPRGKMTKFVRVAM